MSGVGILTFLHNGNYGSSLQAYALQRVIGGMGVECVHIDYQPDAMEKAMNLIRCGNSPRLLAEGERKKKVLREQAGAQEKRRRIQDFYARRMNLTAPCRTRKELRRAAGDFDTLLCGSDQIWNPIWLNSAYFFEFAEPQKRKLAYAPSLGVSVTPRRGKQKKIRRWLSLFDAISVREEEGARVLVSICGKRPPVLPDPVCLLTREEWLEVAAPAPEEEPYLLCYFIGENPSYWEKVRQLSGKTGLKIRIVPVTAEGFAQPEDTLLAGMGPEEFLGALNGADRICTDSFHGLALGTILGKPVELIRRDSDESPDSKNSRVDHFLREVKSKGLDAMRGEGLAWLREELEK